jgi:hypothetical protein
MSTNEVTPIEHVPNISSPIEDDTMMNSGIIKHALRELKSVGYDIDSMNVDLDADSSSDDINEWIVRDVLQLLWTFAQQGHSGMSANYAISMFSKLARQEPLGPITGEDSEWIHITDDNGGSGNLWQNNRCSHVFKDDNGAYDIDGKIFVEPDGSSYTSFESRVPVTFPYTPKREYVHVPAREEEVTI